MVNAGHQMVHRGWALFEEACSEAGPGDLPRLLRHIQTSTTPPPGATPKKEQEATPMDTEEEGAGPSGTPVKVKVEPGMEGEIGTAPVRLKAQDGTFRYGCPNCAALPTRTKRAMDAHIRQYHTKMPHMCTAVGCYFTSYNLDSLHRHEKRCPHKR